MTIDQAIWNEDDIVGLIGKALAARAREYDLENATRGIDCLTEAALQDCICLALNSQNLVARKEARYPEARSIELLNHGQRCDLLLFRDEENVRSFPGENSVKVGYWLEIKRIAQFLESGPNWYYERYLLETLTEDVFKLANDREIFYAGLLVILFASNALTGNRDLNTWKCHALDHGCPVGMPRIHDFAITNRLGNSHVLVALFPMRRL